MERNKAVRRSEQGIDLLPRKRAVHEMDIPPSVDQRLDQAALGLIGVVQLYHQTHRLITRCKCVAERVDGALGILALSHAEDVIHHQEEIRISGQTKLGAAHERTCWSLYRVRHANH